MLPSSQARKSANFTILNSLFTIPESPLPRPPGCLGGSSASCPGSSPEDCSAGCPVESLASCLDGNSAGYSTGCSESCSVSCPASCGEKSSPSCSAECPENCPESSPESNPADSSENRLENSRENCWADCPADCLGGSRCGSVNRPAASMPLLQLDDLGAVTGFAYSRLTLIADPTAHVEVYCIELRSDELRQSQAVTVESPHPQLVWSRLGPHYSAVCPTDALVHGIQVKLKLPRRSGYECVPRVTSNHARELNPALAGAEELDATITLAPRPVTGHDHDDSENTEPNSARSDVDHALPPKLSRSLQFDDLGADAGFCFQNVDAGRERCAEVVPAIPDPAGLARRNLGLPDQPSVLRIHSRNINALQKRIPGNSDTTSERVGTRNPPRQPESDCVTALSHAGRTVPDYLPPASTSVR